MRAVRIGADGRVPAAAGLPPLPAALTAAVAAGQPVSEVRRLGGTRYLVEAAPAGPAGGVLLLQRGSDARGVDGTVLRRFAVALLVGLACGAALGVALARRLARPLVAAAGAAHELAGGQRDVRRPRRGPRGG